MKKWWMGVLVLLGMLGAGMTLNADMTSPKTDSDGHVLTKQWKSFHKAEKADRPQEMSRILKDIQDKAAKKRLAKDFYDAGRQWVYAVQNRNWKEGSQARETFAHEVADFDEPIVTFTWMHEFGGSGTASLFDYARSKARELRAGHNKAFYDDLSGMDGNLPAFLRDDEEYVLWRILQDRYYDGEQPVKDAVYLALEARDKDYYPLNAYLRYAAAQHTYGEKRQAALEGIVKDFEGTAVAMYPKQDLIRTKFSKLQEDKASEQAFKDFYAECTAIEKERKAFRGQEKTIAAPCEGVKNIIGDLTEKELDITSQGRRIDVIFKNMAKADVQFCLWKDDESDKLLWTREVLNGQQRFYLRDTASFELPPMDDGDYVLKTSWAKDKDAMHRFTQYRISLATRAEAGGIAVYAADYDSGEPVKEADLSVRRSGNDKMQEHMVFDGFTRVSDACMEVLRKRNCELTCTYRDADGFLRSSQPVTIWGTSPSTAANSAGNDLRCNVYKDRGAYNPGNTVHYKLVVYKGNLLDDNHTVPAGKKLKVKLLDSEDNEVAAQVLETGEFGSAAGSFQLPTGLRNGMFTLKVYNDSDEDDLLTSHSFRVDEFVLPTFELTFDDREGLYFQGDDIPVSGKVMSYSGHTLSGARLLLSVTRWNRLLLDDIEVPIAEDGTFKTSFRAESTGFFNIHARVIDGTGETLEFSDYVYVISSVSLSVETVGAADGSVTLAKAKNQRSGRWEGITPSIVTTPTVTCSFLVKNTDGQPVPGVPVSYVLEDENGKKLEEGTAASGSTREFKVPASGLYFLEAKVLIKSTSGSEIKSERRITFLRVLPEDTVLDAPVWNFFQVKKDNVADGETFGIRFGAADGPVWAVVTLYQDGGKILDSHMVRLEGAHGKAGSLTDLDYTWDAAWPEAVRMNVFYFRDGKQVRYDHEFRHVSTRLALPLSFSALTDKAVPGTEYTVSLQTEPGIEALAAVWDKSLDAIAANHWPVVRLRAYHAASLDYNIECGSVGGSAVWHPYYAATNGRILRKAGGTRSEMVLVEEMAPMMMDRVVEETVVEGYSASKGGADEEATEADADKVEVREQFEEALTFQPFLRSGEDGNLSFSFRTSDKLSTYYVSVYAHDKAMRNALVRQEMVVSVPVKVSLNAPRYLYEGDLLQLAANVSSNAKEPVAGTLFLYVYDNADHASSKPVSTQRIPLTVPAGGSLAKTFAVRLPKAETVGLKTVFVAKEFSDAVFQAVPVYPRSQTLTEAHSAVLRAGMDEEQLVRELRARFVNIPGKKAEKSVITVLDMVKDAIPGHIDPDGTNVISLTEAYYTRLLAARLRERYPDELGAELTGAGADDLLEQIFACRNADGGFGWFEGMRSSPVITAVILERFAKLAERGFTVPDLTGAVKWLDANQFSNELPSWCGWVSDAQYMHIRARYAYIPFEIKQTGDKKTFDKRMAAFKEYAQDYLVPSKKDGRGLQGQILAKARRIATLRSLLGSDEGKALAKAWGIRFGTESKLRSSMDADFTSLLEYAVEHRDGGWYYPNAVMPYRGLLESEAYAHALLTDLLGDYAPTVAQAGVVADGLRLWLMLQKETQKWDEEPAYVDAITSILDGSEAVLGTKVIALKGTFSKPFEQIKAAGNGFTIDRKFYREVTVEKTAEYRPDETYETRELQEIRPGTPLKVGDRIVVKYVIWNQENRSFVRLSAPREASLMPMNQLSGHYGWSFRPLSISGLGWSLTPQGYRNVKADGTEYYFDSFPEENTTITETFHVTQAGTFTAPVVSIESLYAPHYRANGAFPGALTAR